MSGWVKIVVFIQSPFRPALLACHALLLPSNAAAMPPCPPHMLLRRGPVPLPLAAAGADGNLMSAAGQLSTDAWRAMALASGWRPDMPKRKAMEQAFGSVLAF